MNRKSKFHILTALLLALGILLTGCSGSKAPTEPSAEPAETAAPTQASTEASTEAPTEDPAEVAEDVSRNPLNGTVIDRLHTGRTFAVVFNNAKPALPQHGIGQADILFEFLAEGGVTRCVGLFSDIGSVEKLGSIRSARKYFVSLAQAYDAVLVHAGGSDEALNYIELMGFQDIDGIKGYANSTFYRDQERRNSGYALEHTLFTSGEGLLSCAKDRGYELERPDGVNYGLHFADEVELSGDSASSITITYGIGNKQTFLDYDAETGKYLARQYSRDWVDGNTDGQLAFENALVLYADTAYREDNYTLRIGLTGTGSGYFACSGRMVPITWQRDGEDGMFFFHLEDGSELTLEAGRTYVSVVPQGSTVDFQ